MKQSFTLFLLGLALFSQPLHADENSSSASFWDKLRGKIESLAPQKKLGVTTATGGVRGAPAATEDIYWKNEASAQSVAADELDAFMNAMKLADANDKAQSQAAFSDFIKKFPVSPLRKDAEQALTLLQNTKHPAK